MVQPTLSQIADIALVGEYINNQKLLDQQNIQNNQQPAQQFQNFNSNQQQFCRQCELNIDSSKFAQHLNDCEQRPTRCQYCDQEYPNALMKDHDDQCECKKVMEEMVLKLQHSSQIIQQGANQQIQQIFEEQKQQIQPQQRQNPPNQIQDHEQQGSSIIQFDLILSDIVENISQEDIDRLPEYSFTNNHNLSPSARLCSICQSDFKQDEQIKMLGCTHRFHSQCIIGWLNYKQICPQCKKHAFEGLQ